MGSILHNILLIVCFIGTTVRTSPTGAPRTTCLSMSPAPGHGSTVQTCSNNYIILTDRSTYNVSEPIRVIVRGAASSDTFRGVLLTATSQSDGTLIGVWSSPSSVVKTLTCDGHAADTAVTHMDNSDKTEIQATWTPPSTFINQTAVLKVTIVKTRYAYYLNCFSKNLLIQQGSSNPQTSPGVTTQTAAPTTTSAPGGNVGIEVQWAFNSGVTTIRMIVQNLQPAQWSAFALSRDTSMGQDHVFVCRRLSNNSVTLERYINPDSYNSPTAVANSADLGGTVNVKSVTFNDGVVTCEFTLSNFASGKRKRRQINIFTLSQDSAYYPLIAVGNLDSSNRLVQHLAKEAISKSVQLNRAETFNYNLVSDESRTRLFKAHGIIMVFAWILLVSTGILVAQFCKTAWPDTKIAGKALWFVIHSSVMALATVLTIVAFILILVYTKGKWIPKTNEVEYAHSITGILVICFAMIQPIMALFRPQPQAPRRFIFNLAHGFVGYSALVLSVATLFLAMFFSRFDFEEKNQWGILVAWACWLPIAFLGFFATDVTFSKQVPEVKDDYVNSYELNNSSSNHQKEEMKSNDQLKSRIKSVILIVHILIALGLSIALAVLIGNS